MATSHSTPPTASSPVIDDRVLPLTRRVAWLIAPILAAAFVVLYALPDRTTDLFAWTIRPEMTPVVMGAGYGAGVYFFVRVARADHWHTVAPVFLGITAFTWLMGIATALHWANFDHEHVTFVLWVFLYAVTPLLVPALWLLNQRTTPTPGAARRLPRGVRLLTGGLGVLVTLSALALFAVPDLLVGAWPWAVSPLTARVLAGWFALFGIVDAAAAWDGRWSASRVLVQSELIGFGLVLVGVARFPGNFDSTNPLTYAVVGGMLAYVLGLAGLYWWMER